MMIFRKEIILFFYLFIPFHAFAEDDSQVQKVIESVKRAGAKHGLGEFVGIQDTFLGNVIDVKESRLLIHMRSNHQKNDFLLKRS